MSYRSPEQIESSNSLYDDLYEKPWRMRRRSKCRKFLKKCVHRSERQRVRENIECADYSKKYTGYEY